MKPVISAMGLLLVLIGVIFIFSSNLSYEKQNSTWKIVESEVNTTQISSNFTAGDRVKLIIAPNSEWSRFVEPDLHKYVWVNITDRYGNTTFYEITYAKLPGSYQIAMYNVTLMTADGFGSQDEEPPNKEGIVGKAIYTGEYTAEVWGIFPPGGGLPGSLTFFKEEVTFTTEYPYSGYFYPAIVMVPVGVFLAIWGAKTSKRKVPVKRKTRARLFHHL